MEIDPEQAAADLNTSSAVHAYIRRRNIAAAKYSCDSLCSLTSFPDVKQSSSENVRVTLCD